MFLGEKLGLPVLAKDAFKELLADCFTTMDIELSRRLGAASFKLLFRLAETLLRANVSLIVEANFRADPDQNKFREFLHLGQVTVVECVADPAILLERYQQRHGGDDRHKIHFDLEHLQQRDLVEEWANWPVLNLSCPTITVDTTNVSKVDYLPVVAFIERHR